LDVFLCGKVKNTSQRQSQRAKKTKFCIADVKKAPRCGVKLKEYQTKKNMNPNTQHMSAHASLQDIIRGSLVFGSAEETAAFLKRFFEILAH